MILRVFFCSGPDMKARSKNRPSSNICLGNEISQPAFPVDPYIPELYLGLKYYK